MRVLLCVSLLGGCAWAAADTVNRCEDGEGRVTWSNLPCPAGNRSVPMEVKPSVTDSSGLRDWAKRSPPARMASAPSAKGREAAWVNPVECENARRAYAHEAGWRQRRKETLDAYRREVVRHCGRAP